MSIAIKSNVHLISGSTLTVDSGASLIVASGGVLGGAIINATTGYQVNGAATTGFVLRGNGTNFVSAQLNYSDLAGSPTISLASDSDVLISSPTNGQVLTYNSGSGKWQNTSVGAGSVTSVATAGIATGGTITSTGTITVTGSGNTTTAATAASNLAAAANNNVLVSDGSGNVKSSGIILTTLASLVSPAFSGTPTSITPLTADNSIKIATTAYVQAQFDSPTFTSTTTIANLHVTGTLADGVNAVGSSGQVLSSTGTGTAWITVGGTSTFNALTSGTNTTATMTVGTGATITFSGSGIINANELTGIVISGTPSAGQVLTATSGVAANWQTVSGGGGGSSTLAGDTDVTISSPANGQILVYNSGSGKWVNTTPTPPTGGTVTSVSGTSSQGVETIVSSSVAAITVTGTVRGSLVFVSKTGNQTFADTDRGHFWLSADSSNIAYTLPLPTGSNFQNGWYLNLKNGSTTNTITLTPTGGSLIDGAASLIMPAHMCIMIQCDGTDYHTTSITPVGNNAANLGFFSPNGSAGVPSMRAVVAADLTSAVFGASGGSHSVGVVPDPGSSTGTKKFLREDSSWQNISTAHIIGEVPSGTINGSNVTFTLANTPAAGTVSLYLSGQRLAVTTDYTISGATITFITAPPVQSPVAIILADYIK